MNSTLKWQRTETSHFQVSKTERDESAVKAQQKGFTNNQDHRRREDIWLQILVCRSHQTKENWGKETVQKSVWDLLAPHTWIKTAPDRNNTVDRRKIYDTTTEAHFLPYVHLLVQAHHSTAKHKSHNSRVMAWAKQFREKWHWALAWKPQDCRSTQMWFWMTSFKSSNYPAELMSL